MKVQHRLGRSVFPNGKVVSFLPNDIDQAAEVGVGSPTDGRKPSVLDVFLHHSRRVVAAKH